MTIHSSPYRNATTLGSSADTGPLGLCTRTLAKRNHAENLRYSEHFVQGGAEITLCRIRSQSSTSIQQRGVVGCQRYLTSGGSAAVQSRGCGPTGSLLQKIPVKRTFIGLADTLIRRCVGTSRIPHRQQENASCTSAFKSARNLGGWNESEHRNRPPFCEPVVISSL